MKMKITFKEEGHLYESIPAISWTSVTKVVEMFCNHFDERKQAIRSSANYNSKWFEVGVDKILELWAAERLRSTETGSWYHNKMERLTCDLNYKVYRDKSIPVYAPIKVNGVKYATEQKLVEGIYPEHLIYHEKIGVIGQSDLVFVADGFVDVKDYKTNKKIEMHSYGYKYGNPNMMLGPVSHLEDCNYWHYALQLSIYMYLILAKNKELIPGKLEIIHVTFKVDSYDEYDFPVHARDGEDFIVESVTKYEIPYLRKEAEAILKEIYKGK